jgi:acyl-CoA synthetase (AMP-forming)/AMP-acid ligase II
LSAGVPTVWLALLDYCAQNKFKMSSVKRTLIGGSAVARAMIERVGKEHGVDVVQGWGMTEMSPLGTVGTLKARQAALDHGGRLAVQAKQGRGLFGVEMKIVNEEGRELPWDGKSFGNLLVRGPWVASGYFRGEGGDPLREGWFPTGDVATIDADGYMQITDRSKDVIKSGGEWISSIDLENIAIAHPAIAEAAVIGIRHPKWDERPIVVAVKKPGQDISKDDLLRFYEGKIAKWWMPDDVVFVAELLHLAQPFSAPQAIEEGIVTAVVPQENLLGEAEKAAAALAALPPESIRLTKRLMRTTDEKTVNDRIMEEGRLVLERLRSPEAKEAMSAFLEKRKPDFSRF